MRYYHVWFQTKLKKYLLVDMIDCRIHELFKEIAEEKKISLLAIGSLLDHIHLLMGLENYQDLSWAIKTLKGISSRKIFQEFKLLKQEFRTNNFWARKYGAKEVAMEGLQTTANYIRNQKKDLYVA
ncbi:MAG: putative transposase [Candidatus Saganbacteria bacterium]|uniref:Putative transposase n=1 Tax=Candidatus Saganbacteria bacterium TaxID=2575572 RepID=A0A833KZH9_UNCSA|nr:MAG: putative transposase [Candidatus Saganbacteria bacterium]